jgi:hypothetical protein
MQLLSCRSAASAIFSVQALQELISKAAGKTLIWNLTIISQKILDLYC